MSLFDDNQLQRPFEVVRIEARYNDRRAIANIMKKADIKLPARPIFKDLFSSDISRQILQYEFEQIKGGNLAFDKSKAKSVADFATEIIAVNPNSGLTQILKAVAIKSLYDEIGSRDIRQLIGANSSQWSRLVKEMSSIHFKKKFNNGFDKISQELERFTPVKVKDYISEMKGIDI
ncbi:MAG: hypothetical protein ACK5MU_04480 [Candidatus Saccharimonadales bacterium]